MAIPPKYLAIFHSVSFVLAALASGTLGLPPGIDPATAKTVMAWIMWTNMLAGFLGTMYSSNDAGPLSSDKGAPK